jgi:hypothetical protein
MMHESMNIKDLLSLTTQSLGPEDQIHSLPSCVSAFFSVLILPSEGRGTVWFLLILFFKE